MREGRLEITKIKDKEEKLDIQGQGCWDDCVMWRNNTTLPRCEMSLALSQVRYIKCFPY